MLVFIDFEASSLHVESYPIEVGWCMQDGTGASILIRPEPSWTDWSLESQSVHGICRSTLLSDGVPAADAARHVAQMLSGCSLMSDSTLDERWLDKLLAVAGLPSMPVFSVVEAYRAALRPLLARLPSSAASSVAQSLLRQADSEASSAVPVRHRAFEDARRLWWTWRRLGELVTETASGWPE